MLPDPLHPAVVHLPLALAVLVPLLGAAWIFSIAKGLLPARAWLAVVLLQVLLAASAWLSVETGEAEEERVERVVAERHIEAHHERAERFLIAAGITSLLIAAGLLPDRLGRAGRAVGTLAALVVLAAAVSVGYSGGDLRLPARCGERLYRVERGNAGTRTVTTPHAVTRSARIRAGWGDAAGVDRRRGVSGVRQPWT